MKARIVINGKFLLAALEGMPRVGREITAGFDDLLEQGAYKDVALTVFAPRGAKERASYRNIEVVEVGRTKGPLWEQVEFPMHAGRAYTLNFTGTAPIVKSNGCVVVHDAQLYSTPKSHTLKTFILYGVATPIIAKRYKTIITVSKYAKEEILRYRLCNREDIEIVPNGADHVLRHKVDPAALKRFGLTPQSYALSNSYVHAHKNVRTLLEVFAKMPADRPLVLFGTSREDAFRDRGIAIPPNVRFLGRVTDEDLATLMGSARMFLFPSTTEGFGIPPLEAMLLGCPTLCARAGAMPENCGDGVLYADPYSVSEWQTQIDRLWNSAEQRSRLADAGRAQAAKFKWSSAAKLYLDLMLRDLSVDARSAKTALPAPAAK